MLTYMINRFAAACQPGSGAPDFIPTWYKYLEGETIGGNKCTPVFEIVKDSGGSDIPLVLLAVFEILLFIGGIVAVGYVIYGGFLYMLSQGEPDRMKNAKSTILNALIGLVIAISATAIVNLVGRNIV